MSEEIKIPPEKWYYVFDRISRIDELLIQQVKLLEKIVNLLSTAPTPSAPSVVREITPITPAPPELAPVTDRLDEIRAKLDDIKKEMLKLPNFFDEIAIDTSNTKWKKLNISGLGFVIIDVGGGFSYKLPNSVREFTAQVNERFEGEFEYIMVKGSGVAGTGKIRYWRRM